MASPWTVAQVPAWVVWCLILLAQGAIVYVGFQDGLTGAEPPQHALVMRNVGLLLVGICLVSALLMRWMRPWIWLRNGALSDDRASGWRLFFHFLFCWVLCLVASITSLMIFLVTHDQVMMIVAWCASFVASGLLVPRWASIYRSLDTTDEVTESREKSVEHSD